jgi:hypothetical protein
MAWLAQCMGPPLSPATRHQSEALKGHGCGNCDSIRTSMPSAQELIGKKYAVLAQTIGSLN